MIKTINSAYYIVVTDGVVVDCYPIGRMNDIWLTVDRLCVSHPRHKRIETSYGMRLDPLLPSERTIQITVLTTIR